MRPTQDAQFMPSIASSTSSLCAAYPVSSMARTTPAMSGAPANDHLGPPGGQIDRHRLHARHLGDGAFDAADARGAAHAFDGDLLNIRATCRLIGARTGRNGM
jgi:hypothetical protein